MGLRLDLLGAFLLEKKKENVQESNLLHTTCFFSAVSLFPRGFPTKVSKPLVFGRPHQWAQRHCSCWTILLVAGKQQSLDIGPPRLYFPLGACVSLYPISLPSWEDDQAHGYGAGPWVLAARQISHSGGYAPQCTSQEVKRTE